MFLKYGTHQNESKIGLMELIQTIELKTFASDHFKTRKAEMSTDTKIKAMKLV